MLEPEVWEVISHSPAAYALVGFLGALWGSFGNVCIYRMPMDKSVVYPGSHCGSCGTAVRWYDNIPMLSYLVLRGKCRGCQTEFSPRYLLVEAMTGMLFVAIYHLEIAIVGIETTPGEQLLKIAIWLSLVWLLVVISMIDLDHKLILDKITYPAIPMFYGLGLLLHADWQRGLIGVVVGYGVIWSVDKIYYRCTGRTGIGAGDGKLLAIVGALLGWQAVLASLFLGSIYGTCIVVPLLLIKSIRRGNGTERIAKAEVPFGPFLAMGAVSYIFMAPFLEIHLAILSN